MDLQKSKLIIVVPIVVSILAATFGSIKYIINLTDTIEKNSQQVMMLNKDIQIMETLPKIEIIKTLWQKIDNKTEFIQCVATALGKSPKTLKTHWFSNSGLWSVPAVYQSKVIELQEETIKE